MKKFIFILSLYASVSSNTLLCMKRLSHEPLESLCTKKIMYTAPITPQKQTELFGFYPNFCQQPTSKPIIRNISATEKSFVCTFNGCNKAYTNEQNLIKHKLTHTAKKAYACTAPGCDKSFIYNHMLIKHMHTHTGEKPFTCTFPKCNKSYTNQGNLNRHILQHTNNNPYPCTFKKCPKTFIDKPHLERHLRTHTGEKPFICTFEGCNQSFADQSSCKRHMRIHTNQNSSANEQTYTDFFAVHEQIQIDESLNKQTYNIYIEENHYEDYDNLPLVFDW